MTDARYGRGTILRGKYRVERRLGEGAMGVVLLARHLRLDHEVAVKLLRAGAATHPRAVARFFREARAAAKLKSAHVVRVLDVDETEDGEPFLVMEYLRGHDLDTTLRRGGPLSMEQAVDYVLQACEGVAEAHAAGIVHRDLKPANLFITTGKDRRDVVKVLDFGVATSPAEDAPGLTKADAILGSPSYMSPEQLKSPDAVGPASDVWSLGVVLFELVSGELPFEGGTATALAAKIASEAPRSLAALRPALPAGYVSVVEKCLAKAPEARFASILDLARGLAEVAGPGASVRVMQVAHAARREEPPAPATSSEVSHGRLPSPEADGQRVAARVTAPLSEPSVEPDAKVPERAPEPPPAEEPRPRGQKRSALSLTTILGVGLAIVAGAFGARRLSSGGSDPPVTASPVEAAPSASVSDGSTPRVAARLAAAIDDAGVGFDDLVYGAAIERVVAPAGETGRIVLIEPQSGAVESIEGFSRSPSLRGGHTQGVTSAAVVGTYLAVVDRTARSLVLVDPQRRAILARHALAAVPDYVRFEEGAAELWVTEPDAEQIEIVSVDTKTSKLSRVTTIDVPGGPEHLLFSNLHAYTNLWHGSTTTIDLRTKRLRATFPNGCADSRTLALDAVRALLFVACVEGQITSIDLSHGNRIVGRFSYHGGIDALVFDPGRALLYAPSGASGTMAALSIGREGQPELAFEVATVRGATCATVDASGAVWICDPIGGNLLVTSPPSAPPSRH